MVVLWYPHIWSVLQINIMSVVIWNKIPIMSHDILYVLKYGLTDRPADMIPHPKRYSNFIFTTLWLKLRFGGITYTILDREITISHSRITTSAGWINIFDGQTTIFDGFEGPILLVSKQRVHPSPWKRQACGISGRWSGGVQILSTMCGAAWGHNNSMVCLGKWSCLVGFPCRTIWLVSGADLVACLKAAYALRHFIYFSIGYGGASNQMQQLRDQHILLGRFLHYQFSTFQKPLPLFDSPFLKHPLCIFFPLDHVRLNLEHSNGHRHWRIYRTRNSQYYSYKM